MFNLLKKFVRDEEGQDFVEYALIIGGVSLMLLAGAQVLGPALDGAYSAIAAAI